MIVRFVTAKMQPCCWFYPQHIISIYLKDYNW